MIVRAVIPSVDRLYFFLKVADFTRSKLTPREILGISFPTITGIKYVYSIVILNINGQRKQTQLLLTTHISLQQFFKVKAASQR